MIVCLLMSAAKIVAYRFGLLSVLVALLGYLVIFIYCWVPSPQETNNRSAPAKLEVPESERAPRNYLLDIVSRKLSAIVPPSVSSPKLDRIDTTESKTPESSAFVCDPISTVEI